ncbi:MAG: hypothetical protein ACKVWV_15525 [Planctomycetota bacterium]
MVLVVGKETGYFPSAKAVPAERVHVRFVEYLQSNDLLRDGEQLLYLYSDGILHVQEGCVFCTDRRVVSFAEGWLAENPHLRSVEYADVHQILVDSSDRWSEDAQFEIQGAAGDGLRFGVGQRDDGDVEFARVMREAWTLARRSGRSR